MPFSTKIIITFFPKVCLSLLVYVSVEVHTCPCVQAPRPEEDNRGSALSFFSYSSEETGFLDEYGPRLASGKPQRSSQSCPKELFRWVASELRACALACSPPEPALKPPRPS